MKIGPRDFKRAFRAWVPLKEAAKKLKLAPEAVRKRVLRNLKAFNTKPAPMTGKRGRPVTLFRYKAAGSSKSKAAAK